MVTGAIDHETGTRDINKLGGLLTIMPMTLRLRLFQHWYGRHSTV